MASTGGNDMARGVAKFTQRIKTNILGDSARSKLSQAYAADVAEAMKRHARNGFGLSADGQNLSRLKKLSAKYIRQRARMRLHPETTPGTSNLTRTGVMLDSITTRAGQYPNWVVTMPGSHGRGLTNRQLSRYVSEKRPFLFISKNDQVIFDRRHLQRFNALVNRAFA